MKNEVELTNSEKQEIEELNRIFFKDNLSNNKYTFPKFDLPSFRILKKVNEVVVSQALVVSVSIKLENRIKVASVGEVATLPDFQGKGYASEVLSRLNESLTDGKFNMAMLFCEPKMEGFYKRFGWEVLINPKILIGTSESETRKVDGLTMVKILKMAKEDLEYLKKQKVFLGEPA